MPVTAMGARPILSPEQEAELLALHEEYADAVRAAAAMVRVHGMDSRECLDVERRASHIVRRIRALLGREGKHWMT
jgi:hypothetical protein